MSNLRKPNKSDLELIENAWLNIDIRDEYIQNPIKDIPEAAIEEPYIFFTYMMSRPEYFAAFCKYVMNIELLPYQAVIQQQLWNHKFPMLIASRGAAKSWSLGLYALLRMIFIPNRKIIICGAGFRQSKIIFEYMDGFWQNSPLLRDMLHDRKVGGFKDTDMWRFFINGGTASCLPVGCVTEDTLITTDSGIKSIIALRDDPPKTIWGNAEHRDYGFFFENGVKPVKRIITKKGYEFKCTYNHKIKIFRDNEIIWRRTDELQVGDKTLIDFNDRWFSPSFECTEDQAYTLGAFLGDGEFHNPYYLRYTTIDPDIISVIESTLGKFQAEKDGIHYQLSSKPKTTEFLKFWNLSPAKHFNKVLPSNILCSSKKAMASCLSGLFDSDGGMSYDTNDGGVGCSVRLYTTSPILARQVQYILLHFGIVSSLSNRQRNSSRTGNLCKVGYEVHINGLFVKRFFDQIGFRTKRKKDKQNKILLEKTKWMSYDDSVPFCADFIKEAVKVHQYKKRSFDRVKRYTRYYLKELCDHCEVKNQEYYEKILSIVNDSIFFDEIVEIKALMNLPTYDVNIPKGNEYCANGFYSHNTGDKIRGQRAHDLLTDEFASINPETFETVMAGFASVSSNPVQNTQNAMASEMAARLGVEFEDVEEHEIIKSNQIVISGTAYYSFNHFCTYWERWRKFIQAGSDKRVLDDIFGENNAPADFNPNDYCVIRIPYEKLPKAFMDDAQVARTKASITEGVYKNEFGAVFSADSDGFFRRTLIESCIAHQGKIYKQKEDCYFEPRIYGDPRFKYVMGIDPASEHDNFSIVLLELHEDHRRLVYSWTTTRKNHQARLKNKLVEEHDFYSYVNRKVRDLMTRFEIQHIIIDSQGGGYAVIEAFKNEGNMKEYEQPILEVRDLEKPKDTDRMEGHHIVELATFADAKWFSAANHGLKKDMEEQDLIFPSFDPISLGIAIEEDKLTDRVVDTVQDCIEEVELLKDELCTIVMKQTLSGREQFVTPEEVTSGSKRRQKKDRYSSLVIANMAAREIQNDSVTPIQPHIGGFAGKVKAGDGPLYYGNPVFNTAITEAYKDYE